MTKRRDFIRSSLIATAGLAAGSKGLSANSFRSIPGANDRVNVAVIGIRGMGQNHIQGYSRLKNTRIAALCDVDSNLFGERIKKNFTDTGLEKPRTEKKQT